MTSYVSPRSTDMSLPYRVPSVSETDRIYADVVRKSFDKIPEGIRWIFNELTKNLMSETHINKYALLDAIDKYEVNYRMPINREWRIFYYYAFNYIPYQPC